MKLVKVTPNGMHYATEERGVYVSKIWARKTPTFTALDLVRAAIANPRKGAAFLAGLPFATVATLPNPTSAGVDTYLRAGARTSNFGTDTVLYVKFTADGADRASLIRFDYTGLSGVTAATLTLTLTAAPTANANIALYKILVANSGWTEAGATWNTKDGTNNWASGQNGCTVSGTDFDATAIGSFAIATTDTVGTQYTVTLNLASFQAMLTANYGFLIWQPVAGAPGTPSFASSDHVTAAYRPLLTVTYSAGRRGIISATGAKLGKLI